MLKKRIANIVFYKVSEDEKPVKKATIFYQDGTVSTVSFDEGIDACEEIVKEKNIQTKDAFKEMINRDIVHVVSAKEFRENFNHYVPVVLPIEEDDKLDRAAEIIDEKVVTPIVSKTTTDATIVSEDSVADEEAVLEEAKEVHEEKIAKEVTPVVIPVTVENKENTEATNAVAPVVDPVKGEEVKEETHSSDENDEAEEEVVEDKKEDTADSDIVVAPVAASTDSKSNNGDDNFIFRFDDEEDDKDVEVVSGKETTDGAEVIYNINDDDDEFDEDFDDDYVDSSSKKDEEPKKKEGFFKRLWNKIRKSKVVKTVILCVTALAVACGIYSCAQKKSLEGEMLNSNLPGISRIADDLTDDDTIVILSDDQIINSHFNENAAIAALLNRTSNETQKTAMTNVGLAMDGFNNQFASYYVEEGLDVRPSLKFDEVVALQTAYNDYSKEQLQAIFNGADIRSDDLTRAYKDASLQLMGAYAIETPEHPVDMSMLIESQEGRDFYNRYHEAFLAIKGAEGEEKQQLIHDFYEMVHADFAISQEERTEGISHSSNYTRIQPYQLSVVPMVAAGEMMWQNYDVDNTLTDEEIAFFNDLGLCNFAEHTFERAELVSLTSETDKNNPTYQEYKDAYVNYYRGLGTYYIDDEHRELTKLQSFQEAVNWHFEEGMWIWQGGSYTTTETHTETHSWTETETTYHEEVTSREVSEDEVPADVREDLQDQVDAEIEAENERARREAEEAAERERQRLQQEEDQHAQQVEEEVRQDAEDLQDRIEDANDQIDQNHSDNDSSNDNPVNESDLGHGVDFDDDHSDENGNLDSSVENITMDPTGDKTNEPLPDPNETGRDFDAAAPAANNAAPQSVTVTEEPAPSNTSNDQWVESTPVADDYYYEDSWVEYEEAVDDYVESLTTDTQSDEEAYQYQK